MRVEWTISGWGLYPRHQRRATVRRWGVPLWAVWEEKKYAEECNVGVARLGGSKWRIHPAKVEEGVEEVGKLVTQIPPGGYFFLPYSSFFSCLLSFFFSEHCGQFVCSGFAYYKNVVRKKLQKMLIYRYLRVRIQFIRMGGVEGKIGRNSGWHDSTQLDN